MKLIKDFIGLIFFLIFMFGLIGVMTVIALIFWDMIQWWAEVYFHILYGA